MPTLPEVQEVERFPPPKSNLPSVFALKTRPLFCEAAFDHFSETTNHSLLHWPVRNHGAPKVFRTGSESGHSGSTARNNSTVVYRASVTSRTEGRESAVYKTMKCKSGRFGRPKQQLLVLDLQTDFQQIIVDFSVCCLRALLEQNCESVHSACRNAPS